MKSFKEIGLYLLGALTLYVVLVGINLNRRVVNLEKVNNQIVSAINKIIKQTPDISLKK
jgi:multisubunit Na+/H+ antiporter MnhF subunit